MFSRSPMIFTHLAVSLPTPLPLHVRVQIHWITKAVYLVCASVTKPTRAYATRGTNYCHLTDSPCVRPSLLSVFISPVVIVAAGQRGNAPTWWSSQAGQDYPRHHQRQAGIPAPGPSLTTTTFDSARRLSVECDTNTDNAICYSNFIKINASLFTQELSRHFKVIFLNIQSVRNKTTDICDHVMHANVDLIFLCETWLRPEGDERDCVALTPPGFRLRSFPRLSGEGGGLAVL